MDSLKSSTREKRGKGNRRLVVHQQQCKNNWQDFLRADDNKQELFHCLSQSCASWTIGANKEIAATNGTQVLVSPAHDSSSLAPCLHEEADTMMFVHDADATSRGHKKIIIRTVETSLLQFVYTVLNVSS